MSVSVLIPAYNEAEWINRTIQNILDTATGRIQIIVVDYGGNGEILHDRHVRVLKHSNQGERFAMNRAAEVAKCSHLLRIDAHCDFSPTGWDEILEAATGDKDVTQAVLTATNKQWERLPGHWYERCRLLPNMEAKWEKPNQKEERPGVVPNMSSTGCGFMLRRDFYWEIGGANESYPRMGAIGEEFAIKAWAAGGKCQTCTQVVIGHIFDTGGYGTDGVLESRQCLVRDFGEHYPRLRAKFADLDWQEAEKMPSTDNHSRNREGITIWRDDTTIHRQGDTITKIEIAAHKYLWIPTEHPDEADWTQDQLRDKYAPMAQEYDRISLIRNQEGTFEGK